MHYWPSGFLQAVQCFSGRTPSVRAMSALNGSSTVLASNVNVNALLAVRFRYNFVRAGLVLSLSKILLMRIKIIQILAEK